LISAGTFLHVSTVIILPSVDISHSHDGYFQVAEEPSKSKLGTLMMDIGDLVVTVLGVMSPYLLHELLDMD
jgi:hypothetical protein